MKTKINPSTAGPHYTRFFILSQDIEYHILHMVKRKHDIIEAVF